MRIGNASVCLIHCLRLIAFSILLVFVLQGCATTPQSINLIYKQQNFVTGGKGTILFARPQIKPPLQKFEQGEIIGTVRSIDGGARAPVYAKDSVADWLSTGFVRELEAAGYTVETVSKLSQRVEKGVSVLATKVHSDFSGRSNMFYARLYLQIAIVKNNIHYGTLNIKSIGKIRLGEVAYSQSYAVALMRALQQATQKAVPQIVKELEE